MRSKFAAAVLAAAVLSLAACNQSDQAPTKLDENPTGLVVTNARLILPAVKGNPAVVYFDLKNDGARAVAVRSADIADAKSATIHDMMEFDSKPTMADSGPIAIQKGETIKFVPGGKHVMAFDISPELAAGGKTELTLTVAGGDKVSVAVPVEAANAAR